MSGEPKEWPDREGSGVQECSYCGTPDAVDCDTCEGTGEVDDE